MIAEWPPEILALLRKKNRGDLDDTPTQPLSERLPPSGAAVAALLRRMQPGRCNRDTYVAATHAARGCIMALTEAGTIGDDDEALICDAAVDWALRWELYKGTDELEKWERDFGTATVRTVGWTALQWHAKRLIPEYAEEIAEEEFRPAGKSRARKKRYTARDLQEMDILPLEWILPRYLPEGLTVFAGRPKVGKSWMMLQTALAVSGGGKLFGAEAKQGAWF